MADTIAAIASPPGPGARGVIRVSGPRAAELVRATWAGPGEPPLGARAFAFGRFDDGRGTQPLLLLWMPGPRSFTREDVAELHLPGSPPLLRCALARLYELGARAARAGEFTRRAFENGRIDLARAEGVLALIEARSTSERRAATALLFGGLSERVEALRAGLESLRALCEASLDFDESDTGHVPSEELEREARALSQRIEEALAFELARAPSPAAPRVALAGAPNAGKSALFNALVADGRALVSELAGTTRDGASGTWRIGAVDARLEDAPGFELGARGADALAQRAAERARESAELVLWVVDATRGDLDAMRDEARRLAGGAPLVLAWSKQDLARAAPVPPRELLEGAHAPARWVALSSRTGAGLAELARAVESLFGGGAMEDAEGATGIGRELPARHAEALRRARFELVEARELIVSRAPLDLAAERLRAATDALDEITGRTTPDDLLDRIFARFCIGK